MKKDNSKRLPRDRGGLASRLGSRRGRIHLSLAILPLVAVTVLAGFAVRVHARRSPTSEKTAEGAAGKTPRAANKPASAGLTSKGKKLAAPVASPSPSMEAEVVVVMPDGFQPAAITRPQGSFDLVIENHSGADQVNFNMTLEGGSGTNAFEVLMAKAQVSFYSELDLAPGTYDLTEASHPDWLCRVTITN